MAKGVRGDMLVNFCMTRGFFDGFLDGGLVQVVAARDSSVRVLGEFGGGKEVLPDPVFGCVFIFSFKGVGEINGTEAVGKVFFVDQFDEFEVELKRLNDRIRQGGDAIILAFSIAHNNLMVVKVNIPSTGSGQALTRRRIVSMTRSPPPYITWAMSL